MKINHLLVSIALALKLLAIDAHSPAHMVGIAFRDHNSFLDHPTIFDSYVAQNTPYINEISNCVFTCDYKRRLVFIDECEFDGENQDYSYSTGMWLHDTVMVGKEEDLTYFECFKDGIPKSRISTPVKSYWKESDLSMACNDDDPPIYLIETRHSSELNHLTRCSSAEKGEPNCDCEYSNGSATCKSDNTCLDQLSGVLARSLSPITIVMICVGGLGLIAFGIIISRRRKQKSMKGKSEHEISVSQGPEDIPHVIYGVSSLPEVDAPTQHMEEEVTLPTNTKFCSQCGAKRKNNQPTCQCELAI